MRQRPWCIVFLVLIITIIILKISGLCFKAPDISQDTQSRISSGEPILVQGIVSCGVEKANSILYILKDSKTESSRKSISDNFHTVRIYTSKTNSILKPGTTITAYGALEKYEHATNPGGFDELEYYQAEDCYYHMFTDEIEVKRTEGINLNNVLWSFKEQIKKNIADNTDEDTAAVLEAMIAGDKSDISTETKNDYSLLGISHILAVSGLHVGIIGMIIYKALLRITVHVRAASLGAILFVVLYVLFIGESESAIRAGIMFIVLFGAKIFLRSYDPISSLSLAGSIVLIIRPLSLFRAGFQMSFLAAFAAACIYPEFIKKISNIKKFQKYKLINKIISSALLWFTVNLILLPVILFHYYEFPLYSVISNIIFVPFMSIVLLLGLSGALAGFIAGGIAGILFIVPKLMIMAMSLAADIVSRLPWAMLIIGRPHIWQMTASSAGIILLVFCIYKKKKNFWTVFAACLICMVVIKLPKGFFITALDVGQGDGIVINTETGCFLIDGGSSSEKNISDNCLIPYLKYEGISCVEGIFLSHLDADHISGIEEMLQKQAAGELQIKIKKLILPYWLKKSNEEELEKIKSYASSANIKIMYAYSGDTVRAGEVSFSVLSPKKNDGLKDNEGSMVIALKYRNFNALMTGDIEGNGEKSLTKKIGHYDYLKVAHHGSRNSTSEEFLKKISPKICVISAPKKSIYGHPHTETLERIEESGASWYQTGLVGAVTVTVKNNNIILKTYKR